MSKDLGSRILRLLQERKMTQKDFAQHLNLTEATVSRYLNGEREPKPDMLANIATLLRTTSDFLLGLQKDDGEEQHFDFSQTTRVLARNAASMTKEEKMAIIEALFGKD